MNANIELAIIELETIVKHGNVLIDMYKTRSTYSLVLPAHMHVCVSDAIELIDKGMKGVKHDMALVEAGYLSKRITRLVSGVVKLDHVSDSGIRHAVRAAEDLIDNLRKWAK
ncbi:gp204 [Bacillus phage W.Ph.]|uniref:Gp204 n=1 Tax=Bacillus phage W.Ph. TaxID=764595 RepID=G9B1V5_9CAUD|nr:gp204 [Bacillus phage W.Ph.]ADH03350.1 gp204 [Bacillus phage W.Ph.]